MDFEALHKLRKKLYLRSLGLLIVLIAIVWLVLFLPFHYEHKERKERELDYLLYSKKTQIENYLKLTDTKKDYKNSAGLKEIVTDYQGFGVGGEAILGVLEGGRFEALFATRVDDALHEIIKKPGEWAHILHGEEGKMTYKKDHFILKAIRISDSDLVLVIVINEKEFYSYADNQYNRWLVVAFLIAVFGIYGIVVLTSRLFDKLKQEIGKTLAAKKELEHYKNELEMRVEREVQARETKERLLIEQSKMASMGEMLGFITHQWKQPLTVISMLLENIIEVAGNRAIKDFAGTAKEQLSYINQTITDFRNFLNPSKESTAFDLGKVIQDIERLITPKLVGLNVTLLNQVPNRFFIQGYKNEFKQALLNIINNAVDAIKTYREEHNIAKYEYAGVVSIAAEESEEAIRITVADNGGGIDTAILEKVFDSYFTTKGEAGTGIGLYISKMIIENHMKGEVAASNAEGGGAVFTVTLPLCHAQ